jgi:hypothetical protein
VQPSTMMSKLIEEMQNQLKDSSKVIKQQQA